jgi:hypothetical protein
MCEINEKSERSYIIIERQSAYNEGCWETIMYQEGPSIERMVELLRSEIELDRALGYVRQYRLRKLVENSTVLAIESS